MKTTVGSLSSQISEQRFALLVGAIDSSTVARPIRYWRMDLRGTISRDKKGELIHGALSAVPLTRQASRGDNVAIGGFQYLVEFTEEFIEKYPSTNFP